jgi:hypothetical protein
MNQVSLQPMSVLQIKRAQKESRYARIVFSGISGSGKSYTSIGLGCYIAKRAGGRLCVIDTEGGSANDYGNLFDFDCAPLAPPYTPERYIAAMREVRDAGYPVALVDSFSHMWAGEGGELEMVDTHMDKHKFSKGWREVTPKHNKVISEILNIQMGIIGTLRSKSDYVIEGGGVRKVGTRPVMRDLFEYEFQLAGSMAAATLTIEKSRMHSLIGVGDVFEKPGDEFYEKIWRWLNPAGGAYQPVIEERPEAVAEGEEYTEEDKAAIRAAFPQIKTLAQFKHFVHDKTKAEVMAMVEEA